MPLRLIISPVRGGERQSRTLSKGTLSIGRAAGNDWVLQDPDQHLSRTHCIVSFEDGKYWITDRSTNGLFLNGSRQPTTRDSRFALIEGTNVQFGGYLLEVEEIEERELRDNAAVFGSGNFITSQPDPFASAGGHDGGDPLEVDPLDDPLGRAGAPGFVHPLRSPPPSVRMDDPFDSFPRDRRADPDEDLFRGRTAHDAWQGPTTHDGATPLNQAYSAPKPLPPVNPGEIDFDALLGDDLPMSQPTPAAAPRPPARALPPDPFDELLGDLPPTPTPIPTMAPPAPPPTPAPAPVPVAAPLPPPPMATPAPVSPPATPQPAAPPLPAPPLAVADPAHQAALFAAFLEGAGIAPGDLKDSDPEATMRALGALVRAFVTGTREVLISRAEIKHEMRVEQTMIRSKDNNALKFAISADEALLALLRPPRAGYKKPLDSVEEAFDDIRSHELALMAGMQTGLMALLKRFDPAGLESRLQRGTLDSILPGARKARFWELFCTTYKDIAREAEDDFNAIFGREFARAYTAQVNKL
jgi:type VI secretion system protein